MRPFFWCRWWVYTVRSLWKKRNRGRSSQHRSLPSSWNSVCVCFRERENSVRRKPGMFFGGNETNLMRHFSSLRRNFLFYFFCDLSALTSPTKHCNRSIIRPRVYSMILRSKLRLNTLSQWHCWESDYDKSAFCCYCILYLVLSRFTQKTVFLSCGWQKRMIN